MLKKYYDIKNKAKRIEFKSTIKLKVKALKNIAVQINYIILW